MTPWLDAETIIDLDAVFAVRPVSNNRNGEYESGVQVIATGGATVTLWNDQAQRFTDRYNTFIGQGQYTFTVLAEAA